MLPMFLAVVDQTIVATALPTIAAATGEVQRASWIVVAYLVASTIAAPIYGRLGDAFGRRRLMFVALGVFIVASVACALSPTVELLTLARVLQGLGGGGLMTLSQALIGEAIPPRERARYQGYLATVAMTANSFGPVAGGYLTEHFGWRSIFLINMPIGLGAVALVARMPVTRLSEPHRWRADPADWCCSRFSSRPRCSRSSRRNARILWRCRLQGCFWPPDWRRSSCWCVTRTARHLRSFRSACCACRRSGAATPWPLSTVPPWSRSSRFFRSIMRWCAASRLRRRGCCWCRSRSASVPARFSRAASCTEPALRPLFR